MLAVGEGGRIIVGLSPAADLRPPSPEKKCPPGRLRCQGANGPARPPRSRKGVSAMLEGGGR